MLIPISSRRLAAPVLAAVLLTALPVAAARVTATLDDDDLIMVEIVGILAEVGPDDAAVLARLGPDAIPTLFGALLERRIAAGDAVLGIDGQRKRAVVDALGRLRGSELRAFLRALPRGGPEVRVAADLLAEHGTRDEVTLLAQLFEPPDEVRHVGRDDRKRYESALTRIFEHDPEALGAANKACREAHPSLVSPTVRVVGEAGGPGGLRVLSDLLGWVQGGESLILGEMTRLGPTVPHPVDRRVLSEVRRQLMSSDDAVVIAGIQAVRGLGDTESVGTLIELLTHPFGGGEKAHAALRELTGKRFSAERYAWLEWHREQEAWWKGEAQSQLARLAHGETVEVAAILQGFTGRRLYRHELAPGVTAALRRSEPDIVRLGCAVLGHLGSALVVPELITCLEIEDPGVQEEARRALRTITGVDLGLDADAWRTWHSAQESGW